MSTYTSNIPQPGDDPSASQDQILNNFQSISTLISNNHVQFNDANQGKHKFLQMPEQSSAPSTLADEGALFTQESTLTGNMEMVFRRESSGSEIEFTGLQEAITGWTRLPSGILLKWGTAAGSAGTSSTLFPTASTIPVFTSVFSAQVTVVDATGSPNTFTYLRTISTTQISVFSVRRTDSGTTASSFNYLVIGI